MVLRVMLVVVVMVVKEVTVSAGSLEVAIDVGSDIAGHHLVN